jgi:membrane associated rhomboid family serine protease
MIPLRDNIRSYHLPWTTWVIIAATTLVFIYETSLSPGAREAYVMSWGMIPANLEPFNPATWLNLVSSVFLHGGWFHFLTNMWTLFIFGDNVEDRMGPLRYLAFYLFAGIAANLLQVAFMPASQIPVIGASGAIAGVLGAYFFLYPTARVTTFIPIFFIPWFISIPAIFYLGFWFISQLFSGLASLSMPSNASMGGIAWWAHIGGFLFGLLFVRIFTTRRRDPPPALYGLDTRADDWR